MIMRNTKQLCPELQEIIPKFLKACRDKGLEVRVTECYRTIDEQNALYAKGRTTSGGIVTNCKGTDYQSPHQWGLAFDFCRNDKKDAFDNKDQFFDKVGKIGVTFGLQWGGNWTQGWVDKPHLQIAKYFDYRETTAYIKSKYKNPNAFMKTWKTSKITDNWGNLSSDALTKMIDKNKNLFSTNSTNQSTSGNKNTQSNTQQTTNSVKPTTSTSTYHNGDKITLSNAPLYVSAMAQTKSNTKSGTFYIYNATVTNNRIRITVKSNLVGKTGGCTGWINVKDIKSKSSTSSTTSSTATQSAYYAKPNYTGYSLVDALNKIKVNSSFSNRTKIAKANGIKLYLGTATQNTQLLNLLKQGKLKKV